MSRRPRRGPSPWWRTYFDDIFFELHEPLYGEATSRQEVAAMRELLGLPVGARILDAPCGWGRHTRLFALSGYHTVGVDLSVPLLRRAAGARRRARSAAAGTARYVAADLRALPFADASFDGAINVFTSLGLFLTDREDMRALREAWRVLAFGGRFLLESMHRDDVVRSFAERDRWTLPDGTRVEVRRRFDAVAGVSHEIMRWMRGREGGEKTHALRLRTATEIAALLERAGFREVEFYGGWDAEPFSHRSERLIAVGRKTSDARPR